MIYTIENLTNFHWQVVINLALSNYNINMHVYRYLINSCLYQFQHHFIWENNFHTLTTLESLRNLCDQTKAKQLLLRTPSLSVIAL